MDGTPGLNATVLSQLHVSCFVTASNRASPVFEVLPERHCVRAVNKTPESASEWHFHTVFPATNTHNQDFYQTIVEPALDNVCNMGINTNIIATGVHPTQKFRLLFGKSQQPSVSEVEPNTFNEILETHGQLGALLFQFYTRHQPVGDWRIGISSWIIVNNNVVDLLTTPMPGSHSKGSSDAPLKFRSLEAASFNDAIQILQSVKTNRIVVKHTAEHSHFFVRLAFFNAAARGQLSTIHFADIVDLKEFEDPVSRNEKIELYDIFQSIRTTSPSTPTRTYEMALSKFVLPLLTLNSKTYLYTNVIDSRSNLREGMALLTTVAQVKGFACMSKRTVGIQYEQLEFEGQKQRDEGAMMEQDTDEMTVSATAKEMVQIKESLLTRLAATAPSVPLTRSLSLSESTPSTPPTDAMTWLKAFQQRKHVILHSNTTSPNKDSSIQPQDLAHKEVNTSQTVFPLTSTDLIERLIGRISSSPMKQEDTPSSESTRRISEPAWTPNRLRINDLIAKQNDEDQHKEHLVPTTPKNESVLHRVINDFSPGTLDAVEGANLPTQVMTPPNVQGLDATTAAKIQATDAALLRKNYDALLSIVREQQLLRQAAEKHAAEVVRDQEEFRAQHELEMDNLKLENVSLRSKVRLLEKESSAGALFEQYEQELAQLHREVSTLRDQNVQLELRVAGTDSIGGPGSLIELKRRYHTMHEEKQQLETQLQVYRKKERHFLSQNKIVSDSTRRVDQLSRALSEKEEVLTSARLGKKRLSAEMQQVQHEAQRLQQENDRLLMEKAIATEEVLAARMYMASVESEQKKAEILDQFVKKHGDRMAKQRLEDQRTAIASGHGDDTIGARWRRDTNTRENEEKLFHSIKRVAPQLVPMVNKVLRKLEMQELSLREYSEREVDFINLLVELVSDQPAVALKTMIKDEMKKISALGM